MQESAAGNQGTENERTLRPAENTSLPEPPEDVTVSEEIFRLLVASVKDYAIYLLDPAGHTISWNIGAERIEGYSSGEVLGKSVSRFYLPEDVKSGKPEHLLREATERGRAEDYGWRVRKDGSHFWANVVITALHDQAGNLLGFAQVTRDLTAQKVAEETRERLIRQLEIERTRLEIERSRFQAIWTVAQHGIAFLNVKTDQLMLNPRGIEILGGSPDPDKGLDQYIGRLLYPDGRPMPPEELRPRYLLQGERLPAAEALFVRPDGSRIAIEASIGGVRDPRGAVVGLVLTFRDVSERKRVEEDREHLLDQILAERSWLQTVIERSPSGIILVHGVDGQRIVANSRAEQLLGGHISSSDALVHSMEQVFDLDGTPLTAEEMPVTAALRGEVIEGRELLIRRPEAQDIPVLVSATPIRNEQGKVMGAVVTLQDTTPIKESERLREEWTSLIAHDLRQPVSVIAGYVDLVRNAVGHSAPPDRVFQFLEHIQTSAGYLNKMISDLLDITRIEARRLRVDLVPTDLPDLVRNLAERTSMITSGHEVQVEVNGVIPLVAVDPARLEQALGNLLSNAAKFGYANTPIEIRIERRGNAVELSVTNLGEGIAPEDIPRIFSRFFRSATATDHHIGGLGLGLYITKGLVEAHGGRIRVESVPKQRTTFTITLPLHSGETAAGASSPE